MEVIHIIIILTYEHNKLTVRYLVSLTRMFYLVLSFWALK